ncbi:MAG: GNAT family N-acetyltransferase [Gammaproteobacteria bacterium]|nr:GNAT family N-acetyltransferase [Gammaproteobacteria bacterium]
MSENVTIREAGDDDMPGLAKLAAQSFRDTFEADNDPRNIEDYLRTSLTVEQLRDDFAIATNIFMLAFSGNEDTPVGYVKLSTASSDPSVTSTAALEIERIYADKHVIGRGIGAALMQASIDKATGQDCDTIWLGVWEENKRAIRFYERWYFKAVGTRGFHMGTELQTDLVMARQLG